MSKFIELHAADTNQVCLFNTDKIMVVTILDGSTILKDILNDIYTVKESYLKVRQLLTDKDK